MLFNQAETGLQANKNRNMINDKDGDKKMLVGYLKCNLTIFNKKG